jgi:NTP pyrophosphatase (non-canonical NTP hydrolase)
MIEKNTMNDKQKQIMHITQEECAEVIQAISKSMRFGTNAMYHGVTNQERLEEEVGDLLCMVNLMITRGLLRENEVIRFSKLKEDKLRTWSSIFVEE